MIELTLQELEDSLESLQYIMKQPMRAQTAYKIACLIEEVEKANARYNEIRHQLIEKYAVRNENNEIINNNGNFTIVHEKIDIFNKELTELLATSVTLNTEYLIIDDFEQMELSPLQLIKLKIYIKK